MNMLKGLKTYLVTLVSGVAVPFMTSRYGVSLTPEQQLAFVGGAMTAVAWAMRTISDGTALEGIRKRFTTRNVVIPPDVVEALVRAALPVLVRAIEINTARRIAAKEKV